MYYCMAAAQTTEREPTMTPFDRIEDLFFGARRSAFLISLLCFIGTAISLTGLNALDPALGIVIPVIAIMVLTIFTLMFLLLSFRLFQPINEIVRMTNKLYDDVMRDEMGVELGTDVERKKLKDMTQQVKDLKKEITVLRKEQAKDLKEISVKNGNGHVSSAGKHNWFWPVLILKWLLFVAVVLGMTFIIPNPLNVAFAIAGVVGLTIIALAHAHNKGRLKRSRGDEV